MEKCKISNLSLIRIINLEETYGGNQSWFKENSNCKGGCAIVCASDILCYLSLTNPKFSPICNFRGEIITKELYLNHMYNLRKYIIPISMPFTDINLLGVPFVSKYKKGIRNYCRKFGIEPKFKIFKKNMNVIDFISNALSSNKPIAILQWQNKKLPEFQFHWMTIVSIEYLNNTYILEVLTWGKLFKVNIDDIIKPSGILKRYVLLYIE